MIVGIGRRGMERAMTTTDVSNFGILTFRAYQTARTRQLLTSIAEYWQRARSRYELATLGEADLRDIGLSRGEAEFEPSKAFWQK